MASHVQSMPGTKLHHPSTTKGGSIRQLSRLVLQPRAFFKALPTTQLWIFAAVLMLVITGMTATLQVQTSAQDSANTGQPTGSFSLSLLEETATTTGQTAQSVPNIAAQTATSNSNSNSNSASDSDTMLINALLAASALLVTWAGQTMLLSLVSLFKGHAPKLGKNLQIAVWASLPLTLMLVVRMAHYTNGGSGGALGLSALLETWSDYDALPVFVQRLLAVFLSNVTLFWLWSLALLYFGARYALNGRRFASILALVLWVGMATVVPALVSDPVTTTTPRVTVTTTTNADTTRPTGTGTTAAQQQNVFPGDFSGGGGFPGGGFPGGN